ncbi:MAG: tetratricopeptide repeat protein [Treponema sp.]|nr:tetratricopeptide repeat protein [Treponema sp.]
MNDDEHYYNLATNYYAKEQYDKAISSYTEAIKQNPNYVLARLERGITYAKKKQYDEAISDFTGAIKLRPKIGLYYEIRAMVYDCIDQANADYEKQKNILAIL